MFLQTSKDIITNFFLEKNIRNINNILIKYIDTIELYNNLKNLQDYTITNMKKVCENYNYVLPKLECFIENFFNMFNYSPNKQDLKTKDINHYTEGVDYLLKLEFNIRVPQFGHDYNLFNRYGIRNPSYFNDWTHFNEYKQERLNYFMDLLEQLKKL